MPNRVQFADNLAMNSGLYTLSINPSQINWPFGLLEDNNATIHKVLDGMPITIESSKDQRLYEMTFQGPWKKTASGVGAVATWNTQKDVLIGYRKKFKYIFDGDIGSLGNSGNGQKIFVVDVYTKIANKSGLYYSELVLQFVLA